jgi:hypothetical protein
MKVIPPTQKEMAFKQVQRILMLNPLAMSQYYTNLFSSFKSMMLIMGDEENYKELDKRVKWIEKWISDEFNPLLLEEAELRMWNNWDLLSGFEVNGQLITQMDINSKLEEIKQWLVQLSFEYMGYIRWTQVLRVD